jgi:hypothetical protein
MSSSYSSSLRIELIGSGDQAGTWGTTTDNNLAYLLDTAVAGYQAVSVTTANQALTYINGATATASLNQSVYALLKFTTTTGAGFSVYAPPVSKMYIIFNNSGYSMTLYNSTVIGNTTPAGTGLTIPDGAKYVAFSDGTNFYKTDSGTGTVTSVAVSGGTTGLTTSGGPVTGSGTITLAGTLGVANGGTGATTFASGGLLKGAGAGVVTTASAAEIVAQIGATAVTNATNATNATNLATTNFTIQESGGKLIIKYGATTILSITSAGLVTSSSSFSAGGTP